MRKYKPSNGEEGMAFEKDFCLQCEYDRASWEREDYENGCKVLAATFSYLVTSPSYPDEWTYDEDGKPTCTKFKKAA
ncbi:MAG: hypothetical protein WCQ90_06005 [Deltaproteobacteria bacterium]